MSEENVYPVSMNKFYELSPKVRARLVQSPEFQNAVQALIDGNTPVEAPIILTSPAAPTAEVGLSYTWTPGRTGDTPISWSVSIGALPAGLSINSSTGVVSGTPTTEGTSNFTLQATNSGGSDTQAFSIVVSSTADIFTVFGSTAPAEPTTQTDADNGSWLSQMFYVPGTGADLLSAFIDGVRLYVPIGSSHIGQTWRAGLVLRTGAGVINDVTFGGQAQYDANGSKVEGSVLVAGWNEVDFSTEYSGVDNSEVFMLGVQIGDGTRYLHVATGLSDDAIFAEGGANYVLADKSFRCWYRDDQSDSAEWYGIDAKVRIPT